MRAFGQAHTCSEHHGFVRAGELPDSIYLAQLERVHLQFNDLAGAYGSGGNTPRLRDLHSVRAGGLSSFCKLTNLKSLDLRSNQISGALVVLITRVHSFRLGTRTGTGPIPPAICKMDKLRDLRLYDNLLFGSSETRS